ncbi:TPA: phage tail sheath C-terminal domain-containing protein [Enterobacter ludwigii]|uniref:phage tail sheath C-terminal domain-containing protein n=1 Tax=Enterobacter ludwigii TaxID=299767 RepID=UPI003B5D3E27
MTIPSVLKPGDYFEFNTTLGARSLATNDQKLVILAQRTTSGSVAALTPVNIFSEEEAADSFGRGSQAHRMATAAINANPYIQLTVVGIDDDGAAIEATGTVTLSGPATGSGQVRLLVCNTLVAVAVRENDTANALASALVSAVNNNTGLPVTAAATDNVVTITARNKGACGNEIGLVATTTAAGVTAVLAPMTGGQGDPSLSPVLASIFSAGHTLVISPYTSADALSLLSVHLNNVSGPLEQRGAMGVTGWNGTLAAGTTLTTTLNAPRVTTGWHDGSQLPNGELAAVYAAIIASEPDPARPLQTLTLPGLDITPQSKWPGRTEQENALANGLAPFEVVGSSVQIVRAISTYVKDAEGVTDRTLMDITIIRSLDYVRLACRTRISQRFPRDKLTDARIAKMRSELLDVLYKLEGLEIVENVDANKAQLTVTRDAQDDSRADANIPAAIVRGLHVFAGTIYLL